MVRPQKCRRIVGRPVCDVFKPRGVPMRALEKVLLSLDEFEAVRLADHEGLDQSAAAERMNISRPTFTRLIETARHKVATAIVAGRALVIAGGMVHIGDDDSECPRCRCRKEKDQTDHNQ